MGIFLIYPFLHIFPDLGLSLYIYIVCLLFLSYRSEQVPNWHLLKTQGQCMKEHDNSLKEEVRGEVIFLVTTKD